MWLFEGLYLTKEKGFQMHYYLSKLSTNQDAADSPVIRLMWFNTVLISRWSWRKPLEVEQKDSEQDEVWSRPSLPQIHWSIKSLCGTFQDQMLRMD